MEEEEDDLCSPEGQVAEAIAMVLSGLRVRCIRRLWPFIRLAYHFVAVALARDPAAADEAIKTLAVLTERGDVDELQLWSLLLRADPEEEGDA